MVCRDVEENQIAEKYLNGQLNEAAQDDFELHILECEGCQSSLELLQSVRDDLVARADEIRTFSRARRRPRWVWAAVPALVVLVMAFGLLQLRKLQRTAVVPAKLQTPSKDGTSKTDTFALLSTDNLPVTNRRNYGNFTLRDDNAPYEARGKSTPKDRSKKNTLDITGKRTRSDQINISDQDLAGTADTILADGQLHNPASKSDESIVSQGTQRQTISAMLDKLKLPQSLAHDKAFVAELQYLEARRLSVNDEHLRIADDAISSVASVQAPPYTFSGSSAVSHADGPANSMVAGVPNRTDQPAMAQSLFHDAMLAYAEKRYHDAETLLKSTAQSAPGSSEINFYLGICALLGDRANEAIEPLQFVLTKENSSYSQSAHFYLGKAYLQMRDISHAQAELESAAVMPGRQRAEAASTLARLRAILVFQSEEKPETVKAPDEKN